MAYHPVYLATALGKYMYRIYILFICFVFIVQHAETYKNISVDIIVSEPKNDEMCMSCSTHGEKRNAWRILVVKAEGRTALGRPKYMWEANIKMNITEIQWGGMDWIDLAEDRNQWTAAVNTFTKFRPPQSIGKFLST
jgi:hypothetical protein